MRLSLKLLPAVAVFAVLTLTGQAQRMPNDPTGYIPRATVFGGYNFIHSNAPPGESQKFNINGFFVGGSIEAKYWLGFAGEYTRGHATSIGPLGQDLDLNTVVFGPRVTARQPRLSEFGQVLFGFAHAGDSYFPTRTSYSTTASSYALTAGGGIDYHLSHRFSIRAIELQYLHTAFPNGVNSSENHLSASVGFVVNFAGHYVSPSRRHVAEAAPPRKHVSMTCSASVRTVQRGETLNITALTRQSDNETVTFAWTSDAAVIQTDTAVAQLDTRDLEPGSYRITGHAALVSDGSVTASCDVPFRVVAKPEAPKPTMTTQATPMPTPQTERHGEQEFHEQVADILFDYDKATLRADNIAALAHAASYLAQHPEIHVLIGGSSDERGTDEYNIALGLKRANTVRDALVQAGIATDRITVVSYGKSSPVCTAAQEVCYQRNRRAAFQLASK